MIYGRVHYLLCVHDKPRADYKWLTDVQTWRPAAGIVCGSFYFIDKEFIIIRNNQSMYPKSGQGDVEHL